METSPKTTSASLLQRYQRLFILGLLGVLLLLLIMVSGVVTRQQSNLLRENLLRRGIATQQHLAELTRGPLATGKTRDLLDLVQIAQLTDDDIDSILILDNKGYVVAATTPNSPLPIEIANLDSVVSNRDYVQGNERIFLSPIRSTSGDILGVSCLRMSEKKIMRQAFEAAAKLDIAIGFVFVIVGLLMNALLKKLQALTTQEMVQTRRLADAFETEKRLQSQLIQSEKMATLGQLASSMAHELRNPLAGIKNALYIIRDSFKNKPALQQDPTLPEFFDLAENEVKAATRIITDLMDYSRVVQIHPQTTDLHALLQDVGRALHAPDTIQLIETFAPELPPVVMDPGMMKQVFLHIGTNAIQAMDAGGQLQIKTRLLSQGNGDPPWVVIDFVDNGEGIAAENKSKIFEPMFSTKNNGTGLGLPISLRIVKAHGGTIDVESGPPIKGTIFTVRFPLKGDSYGG